MATHKLSFIGNVNKVFKEKICNDFFIKSVKPKLSPTHGVGCFATHDIKENEIFEISPVLLYTPKMFRMFQAETETCHIHEHYVFHWEAGVVATAWGYVSLYNHSNDHANADYRLRKNEDYPAIEVYAIQDIKVGDEIYLHYMHNHIDIEFGPHGDWWAAHESDMSSALGGYDTSASKLMIDVSLDKKNYR